MDIDLQQIAFNLTHLGIAFVMALPLGWDREQSERTMGMRTFPLIAMASCGFLILGRVLSEGDPGAQARLLQGAMTGIGFLGGGAIVKKGLTVRGTATAASIWITAAIGAAAAFGRYEIGVALSAVTFVTLRFLYPLKGFARKANDAPHE